MLPGFRLRFWIMAWKSGWLRYSRVCRLGKMMSRARDGRIIVEQITGLVGQCSMAKVKDVHLWGGAP